MESVSPDDLAAWIIERRGRADRFLFGIAGPPGSGKSTLAARLGAELDAPVVAMDGFHLPNAELIERGQLGVKGAPETFAAAAFVDLVRQLRRANAVVDCPIFDRTIDEPVADQIRVTADDAIVIVEGNYLLLDEAPWGALADLFDATAYIDVPDDVRIGRLVDRHVAFGRTRSEALDFVRRSDEPNARRIEPGRRRADVLVSSPAAPSS
jgi:pantothenate kinase